MGVRRRVVVGDPLVAHRAVAHHDVAGGQPTLQCAGGADADEAAHADGRQRFERRGGGRRADAEPADHPDPIPNPSGTRLGGYQQLVRGEVMRGRFRNSFEKPEPFEPGRPTVIRFKLPDVNHTFRAGHKIMVQVQSSWFPLVDRNPQTFVNIAGAKESDFRLATHRVFRSKGRASRLVVQTLPR